MADELALMRETIEPPQSAGRFDWTKHVLPFVYPLLVLSLFAFLMLFTPWRATDFFCFTCPIMFLAFGAALFWGAKRGYISLACLVAATWQLRADGISMFFDIVLGLSFVVTASILRTVMNQQEQNEGRLAWQSMELQSRNVLWHNGMVGGSASFIGVVEDVGVGVVILTNTAKSVDLIGVDILTKLIELQEHKQSCLLYTSPSPRDRG